MNPKKEKRVINFIKKHPYSIEIMQSIGKPDLDCSMLFRNHFDLHMFMKEFRFLFSRLSVATFFISFRLICAGS